MSEQITLTGMVLSSMPAGEYDKRIVVLTRERGKITAFARGARRPKSSLSAATNLFAFGTFTAYEGKSAYTVVRADISNYFLEISRDYDAACYGSYCLEAADYFTEENADASDLLKVLYLALRALISGKIEKALIRLIVELRLLYYNGTYPELFHCVNCGRTEDLVCYDQIRKGLLCHSCAEVQGGRPLSVSAVYTLQYILSSAPERLFTFRVTPEVMEEITPVIRRLFRAHVDRPLKSEVFLE